MKIALITIQHSDNYGAVLQAFATKTILSKFGEVKTIYYDNKFVTQHLDVIRFKPTTHGLKMFAHDLLRIVPRKRMVKKFEAFIELNMNLTTKITAKNLLSGKLDKFDAYICGSDQIWCPACINEDKDIDPIYFLEFAPQKSKKISYASSMGAIELSDSKLNQVKSLLSDFHAVSVRENDAKTLLTTLLEKPVNQVLDPTFLLSKQEWFKAINVTEEPKSDEQYILVYTAPRMPLIKNAITFFSKKLGLKVVAIDKMLLPLGKLDKHIKDAGPCDFIQLFANASFVITDSYHGVCFSINFGKPFAAIAPGNRVNRIESLLSLLNIDMRIVNNEEEFKNIPIDIDDEKIQLQLSAARAESIKFLTKSLMAINGD